MPFMPVSRRVPSSTALSSADADLKPPSTGKKVSCGVANSPHVIVSLSIDDTTTVNELKTAIAAREGFRFPASEMKLYAAVTIENKWVNELEWKRSVNKCPETSDALELWDTEFVERALLRFNGDIKTTGAINIAVVLPEYYDNQLAESAAKRTSKMEVTSSDTRERWNVINHWRSNKANTADLYVMYESITQSYSQRVAEIDQETVEAISSEFDQKNEMYGKILTGTEPAKLFFIEAMLDQAVSLFEEFDEDNAVDDNNAASTEATTYGMAYKHAINGDYIGIGTCLDFVVKKNNRPICAVLISEDDFGASLQRAILAMEIMHDSNGVDYAAAIVTDFRTWSFMYYQGDQFFKDDQLMGDPTNHDDVERILGKICALAWSAGGVVQ